MKDEKLSLSKLKNDKREIEEIKKKKARTVSTYIFIYALKLPFIEASG